MKRNGIFLFLTFAVSWILCFILMFNGGLESQYAQLVFSIHMLIPGGMVFITRGITREGYNDPYLKPGFKKNWKYFIMGWLGTLGLVFIGFVVYFLVFSNQFDWNMTKTVAAYLKRYPEETEDSIRHALYIQMASTLYMPIFFNGLMCFCEEMGFRGYLQTHLESSYGRIRSILFSGIIWGIWYSPWIIMGYEYDVDYPLYPLLGCVAMILYCTVVGIYLSWLKVRTNSIWPGALASTMLNAAGSIGGYFMNTEDYNLLLGPCPTGLLGGIGFIAMSVLCVRLLQKKNK